MNFLLVYDRLAGALLSERVFESAADALRERFKIERGSKGRNIEVVVVSADSREDLVRTHGRYFMNGSELTDRAERSVG